MLSRRCVRPSHHMNGFINAFCSISRSLCEYTYTRMILSKSEEILREAFAQFFPPSTIREVVLVPNRHWGGEGLLGCVFG